MVTWTNRQSEDFIFQSFELPPSVSDDLHLDKNVAPCEENFHVDPNGQPPYGP